MDAEQYVTDEARYAERMDEASGVSGGAQANMAPYPLYGLGQPAAEPAVPLWKKPWFCYSFGAAVGVGIGYGIFGWLMPKYVRKNRRRKKKSAE